MAADVCRVLELENVTNALRGIDRDDLTNCNVIDSIGRQQEARAVNESGLYQLIFASRKPEAKAFKRWITREVIPSIRRTGSYAVSATPALPGSYLDALKALVVATEAKEALALENAELKPKAEFFDAVAGSDDTLAMNEAAKLVNIGRNTLMSLLRKKEVFRKNNTPFQRYIDTGYFKVVESNWTHPDTGEAHVTVSTRVFQRGLDFLRRLIAGQPEAPQPL